MKPAAPHPYTGDGIRDHAGRDRSADRQRAVPGAVGVQFLKQRAGERR